MRLKPDGGDYNLRLRKRSGFAATPKNQVTPEKEGESVVERVLFATDVEGIESVGAVGAVFEQVFFALCKFLARLILAEAVASAAYPAD